MKKRLASIFNVNFGEASAIFSQYQRSELSKDYSKKVSMVLETAGKEWGQYLKKLLNEVARDKPLPQNIYFCGPAASFKEIQSQVSNEDFAKFTIFGKPFNVKFLSPDSLKHYFDFAKGFSGDKDIFLLISALFANKFSLYNKKYE